MMHTKFTPSPIFLLLITVLTAAMLVPAANAVELVYVGSHGTRIVIDSEDPAFHRVSPQASKVQSVFNVTYLDVENNTNNGFDDTSQGAARRDMAEVALEYVVSVLNVTGECDVVFEESQTGGNGALAEAGTYFATGPAGFTNGEAFKRLVGGGDTYPALEEIYATVDFGYNWNASEADPAGNEYDLLSVLIHEISHGLGFTSLAGQNGASDIATGVYTYWDSFLETGNGTALFVESGGIPTYMGTGTSLVGADGGVVFTGTQAVLNFGGDAPIYAPGSWNDGSSISHWNSGIDGGAIMEPSTGTGDMLRVYAPVEIGALIDIGYANAATLDVEGEGEGEGEDYSGFITASTNFPIVGESFALTAPEGSNYNWSHEGDPIGGDSATLSIGELAPDSDGTYWVTFEPEGGGKAPVTLYYVLTLFPEGSSVPAVSLVGLGLLAGIGLAGGMFRNRKK